MKTDILGNSREIMIDTRAFLIIHKKTINMNAGININYVKLSEITYYKPFPTMTKFST